MDYQNQMSMSLMQPNGGFGSTNSGMTNGYMNQSMPGASELQAADNPNIQQGGGMNMPGGPGLTGGSPMGGSPPQMMGGMGWQTGNPMMGGSPANMGQLPQMPQMGASTFNQFL